MTAEHHIPEQLPPLVPPRFNSPLYCGPEGLNRPPLDILVTYDPVAMGTAPDFIDQLWAEYDEIKGSPSPKPRGSDTSYRQPSLDLRTPDGVDSMITHTITHAITGLLDAGTSDTKCIPYWDHQAVRVGALEQDPASAQNKIELMDVLSMNVLRSHLQYSGMHAQEHLKRIRLLNASILKGQVSMVSMVSRQEERVERNQHELDIYTKLFTAKLKHLTWLVDRQTDPVIRQHMLSEVKGYAAFAGDMLGVPIANLIMDMGSDTGISNVTDRPLYDTAVFIQLAHTHNRTQRRQFYHLPHVRCHRIPMTQMLESIARPGTDWPFYEQDGRYHLPWKFDD